MLILFVDVARECDSDSDTVQWWPFIGCHMCIWTNELAPCGLGTACVAFWTELTYF